MNPEVGPALAGSTPTPGLTSLPPDADPGSPSGQSTWAGPPDGGPAFPSALSHPQMMGDYQILGELGRGGMGVVYKACDLELKRLVALKMLWAGAEASPDELVRFRGEAELVAQLQHPHIVQIYDIGQHEGRPYLALEFVDGGSLDKRTQGQPQPPRQAAETIEILARTIHAAHQQGIIHRDLKPANILLTTSGTLKISDFGLAKRLDHSLGCSRTGEIMGTPSYMAPEQAAGQTRQVGPATDIYALGAILYELLTGRPPFRGVTVLDTLEQVRTAEPAPPSRLIPKLHRDLGTICLKCLQKAPARRYASAAALADDLRHWLDGHPIQARPISVWERLWRAIRRRPLLAALVVSSVLMLVALVLLGLQAQEQRHQRAQRDSLQQQQDHSLAALNGILDLVTHNGPLHHTPGLKPLHQKLLAYYEDLVRRQEQDQLARKDQLADACDRLGRLISEKGNKAEALQAFQKAQKLYEALAEDPAQALLARHKLAQTHLEQGKLRRELGQQALAEEEYRQALANLSALHQQDASNLDYQQDLAEVWHNLGILYAPTDKTKALATYQKALELREELHRLRKENLRYQRDLARSHGYIGDVELDQGYMARADASYWESHRFRLRLAADEKNPEAQFQLARSFGNFGNYQMRVRALNTAIDFFEQARKIQEKLVKSNPAVEYQSDLGSTYNRIAELKLLQIADTPQRRSELAEQVRQLLEQALRDTWGPLYDADPDAVGLRSGLAESHTLLAELLVDPDSAAATAALDQAHRLLQGLSALRPDPDDLYHLAMVQALSSELVGGMGQSPPKAPEPPRCTPEQAVQTLRQALDNGYRRKHPDDVKQERAFRALRDRPDFQDLVHRLGLALGRASGESPRF